MNYTKTFTICKKNSATKYTNALKLINNCRINASNKEKEIITEEGPPSQWNENKASLPVAIKNATITAQNMINPVISAFLINQNNQLTKKKHLLKLNVIHNIKRDRCFVQPGSVASILYLLLKREKGGP